MYFRVILVCIVAAQALFFVSGCERLKDSRVRSYYEKASEFYEKGDYNRAAKECRNALVFDEDNVDALTLLAKCYIENKQYKNAAESFVQAFADAGNRPDLLARAVDAYFLLGKHGKSILISKEMMEDNPDYAYARYLNARARLRMMNVKWWGEAGTILQPLLDNEEYGQRAYALLAQFHIFNDEYEKAEQLLFEHAAPNDDWFFAMRRLARKYDSSDDLGAAVRLYEKILDVDSSSVQDIQSLRELLRRSGRKEEERQLIESLIAGNPQEIRYKLQLIDFLIYHKQFKKAEQYALGGVQQEEDFFEFLLRLIDVYEKTQRYDEAIRTVKNFLKRLGEEEREKEVELLNNLAWLYYLDNKRDVSKFVVRWTLDMDGEDPTARFLLARISLDEGRSLLAIAELRRLTAEDTENPEYDYYTGLAHLQRSELGAAEQSFKAALVNNPSYKEALLHLANIYFQKGQVMDVEKMIDAYLAISPGDPQVLALQAKLSEKLVSSDREMEEKTYKGIEQQRGEEIKQ